MFQKIFSFTLTWGNDPIWRTYFSSGLVQPPTSHLVSVFLGDWFIHTLRFKLGSWTWTEGEIPFRNHHFIFSASIIILWDVYLYIFIYIYICNICIIFVIQLFEYSFQSASFMKQPFETKLFRRVTPTLPRSQTSISSIRWSVFPKHARYSHSKKILFARSSQFHIISYYFPTDHYITTVWIYFVSTDIDWESN